MVITMIFIYFIMIVMSSCKFLESPKNIPADFRLLGAWKILPSRSLEFMRCAPAAFHVSISMPAIVHLTCLGRG